MKKRPVLSAVILIFTAMIWGTAFVAQDKASEFAGPFTINGIRFFIGAMILIPVIVVTGKSKKQTIFESNAKSRKTLIIASIISGLALSIASNIQQFGIESYPDEAATSGRAGFITAMYVILVPILNFIVFRKKISLTLFLALLLSVAGLYLLCLSGGISNIYTGDIIILCCALAFAIQILAVDYFIEKTDPIKLSCLSFFVCSISSLILMFIYEKPDISKLSESWMSILYLGIFSSGIAYTLQIIGQKYSDNPTVASILMSLESVFAVIAGAVLMNEKLTGRELIGCIIMFLAIILAQIKIPVKQKK